MALGSAVGRVVLVGTIGVAVDVAVSVGVAVLVGVVVFVSVAVLVSVAVSVGVVVSVAVGLLVGVGGGAFAIHGRKMSAAGVSVVCNIGCADVGAEVIVRMSTTMAIRGRVRSDQRVMEWLLYQDSNGSVYLLYTSFLFGKSNFLNLT